MIDWSTITLKDLAGYISEELRNKGIGTILVGGACVTIYSANRYQSYDLDYITYEDMKKVKMALSELGFTEKNQFFEHEECQWIIEFVSPPVAVGNEPIFKFNNINTPLGTIRLLRPEDSVKDRLSSYYHWNDKESLKQAIGICLEQQIDLGEVDKWSVQEGQQKKFSFFMEQLNEEYRLIKFNFRPISYADISLLHQWFNTPHVQAFYSLREWSEEEVREKLRPILEKRKNLFAFIVLADKKPVGYVQYCPISENPWPDQEIEEDVVQSAAGLDLFIGDSGSIGKGLGSQIVLAFLEREIWPKFSWCFVDPDVRNEASMRCFQKSGFQFHKIIATEDALKRPVTLTLMKKSLKSV